MTVSKAPIYPHLVRKVPEQFSWVDHRLVRERYIDYLSHSAAALYLFLVTVSDARGLSYYGDASLQKRLGMQEDVLVAAREALIRQRLIAFKKPLYQVLPMEPRREPADASGEPCSMGQILRQIMGGGA
jgi:hypothetical protein